MLSSRSGLSCIPQREKNKKVVDPESFKEARLIAGLSIAQTAEILGITSKTVRNWETGKSRVPAGYFDLLRFHSGYALPDPAWPGWTMHSGHLWSPDNKGFRPDELGQLWLTVQKARLWERWQKPDRAPPAEPTQLRLAGMGPIWKEKS